MFRLVASFFPLPLEPCDEHVGKGGTEGKSHGKGDYKLTKEINYRCHIRLLSSENHRHHRWQSHRRRKRGLQAVLRHGSFVGYSDHTRCRDSRLS